MLKLSVNHIEVEFGFDNTPGNIIIMRPKKSKSLYMIKNANNFIFMLTVG